MEAQIREFIESHRRGIDDFYFVPPEMKGEVDFFFEKLESLGEAFTDLGEFQQAYEHSGLKATYLELFQKLIPNMEAIEKMQSEFEVEPVTLSECITKKDIASSVIQLAKTDVEIQVDTEMTQARYRAEHKVEKALGVDMGTIGHGKFLFSLFRKK